MAGNSKICSSYWTKAHRCQPPTEQTPPKRQINADHTQYRFPKLTLRSTAVRMTSSTAYGVGARFKNKQLIGKVVFVSRGGRKKQLLDWKAKIFHAFFDFLPSYFLEMCQSIYLAQCHSV